MLTNFPSPDSEPLVLIVPGLDNSGPNTCRTCWLPGSH